MCGKISMSSANDFDAQCLITSMEDFFQNLYSSQFHQVGNVISSQCGWVQVMMATLVFILPNKKEGGKKLMTWGDCKKLPWDIVLVLGGGMCSLSLTLKSDPMIF